ncbi:rhomboid-like protein [Streptomyces sp. I05A-00742]|uniref:rhomboid-like protein n=1 Tax=Streptomyces sp. I05A-00742 TaxID=2732853 RepID=UPI0020181ED9|nr:rhomboid-like protein [Streptomyces sp. I05A-00742]
MISEPSQTSSRSRLPRFAPAYVGGVQLGAYAARRLLTPARRVRLLRRCSTNADNLDAGRWDTLATSAAVVEHPMDLGYALLLLAVLGYTEYAHGAWWAAGTFAWGHVGASLLVYGGLRAVHARSSTRSAIDVGTSYGFNAVAGALAVTLPAGRLRTGACSALLALGIRPLARNRPGFTDAGHLLALLLGMGLGAARGRTLAR